MLQKREIQKGEMKMKDLIKKFHMGDHITDKELKQLIKHYENLIKNLKYHDKFYDCIIIGLNNILNSLYISMDFRKLK